MKIKIKEYRRGDETVPVVRGFFPEAGLRMKPGDVYECMSEEHFQSCMGTGNVEQTEGEVTESLLERRAILLGEAERDRDLNRAPEQAEAVAAQQAAILQQAQENAMLKNTLEQMQERLEALETKPKRGRPRKNEQAA